MFDSGDDKSICWKSEYNYLGYIISSRLGWRNLLKDIEFKVRKRISLTKSFKLFGCSSPSLRKALFYSHVLPLFTWVYPVYPLFTRNLEGGCGWNNYLNPTAHPQRYPLLHPYPRPHPSIPHTQKHPYRDPRQPISHIQAHWSQNPETHTIQTHNPYLDVSLIFDMSMSFNPQQKQTNVWLTLADSWRAVRWTWIMNRRYCNIIQLFLFFAINESD